MLHSYLVSITFSKDWTDALPDPYFDIFVSQFLVVMLVCYADVHLFNNEIIFRNVTCFSGKRSGLLLPKSVLVESYLQN